MPATVPHRHPHQQPAGQPPRRRRPAPASLVVSSLALRVGIAVVLSATLWAVVLWALR